MAAEQVQDERATEGVADAVIEQPMIHDQTYWDQDMDRLVAGWEAVNGAPTSEKLPEFVEFIWESMLLYREVVRQLATEKPAEVKPAKKRTAKVPKAALPETPDAA